MTGLTHDQRIAGFYTLASTSLLLSELPVNLGKKLPRCPSVPAVRMGRLIRISKAWVSAAHGWPTRLSEPFVRKLQPMSWWLMQRTNQQLIISWQPVERTGPASRPGRFPRKIRWRPGAADWPDWSRRCNSHNGQIRRLARRA